MLKSIRPLRHIHRAVASCGQRCVPALAAPGRWPAPGRAGGWTLQLRFGLVGLGSRLSCTAQPWARPGRATPSPLSGRAEALGGSRGIRVTQARGHGDPGRRQEGKAAGAQGSGQQQCAAAWAEGIAPRSDDERGLQIIYIGNFRINCCWNPSPQKAEPVNVNRF